ncbi:MAG: TIGR02147 family protein, partial [Bdellovibrio sp.]|nr:TIGR02147 family protein [Bdellovibrio sp.]
MKIFDYLDLATYLSDVYKERRERESKFSFSYWAEQLGVGSKSQVQLIVYGKRLLNPKHVQVFIDNLQLKGQEAEYFTLLVDLSHASSTSQRKSVNEALLKIQRNRYVQYELSAHSKILDDALYPVIMTLMNFSDVEKRPEKIAALLNSPLEKVQAGFQEVLNDTAMKDYQAANKPLSSIKIPENNHHHNLVNYYTYWIQKSIDAIQLPKEVRKFRSLQMALSKSEFEDFTNRMNEFAMVLLNKY